MKKKVIYNLNDSFNSHESTTGFRQLTCLIILSEQHINMQCKLIKLMLIGFFSSELALVFIIAVYYIFQNWMLILST